MNEKKLMMIAIGILSLLLIIVLFSTDFKQLKRDRVAKKIATEQFDKLLSIHTFNNVFKIDEEQIEIDDLWYKKILNYEEVLNENFTENGKKILNENFKKYILQIGNNYYIKLDELNFETEYNKSQFKKVEVTENRIDYNIKTSIKFIDQKGTLDNKIILIKEKDKWLIDNYKIEKYNYVYKD